MSRGPYLVRWTDHAVVKAAMLALARADVEKAVIEHHDARQTNPGAAEWKVIVGRLVVVYNYPDQDDSSTARIVTLWRRR